MGRTLQRKEIITAEVGGASDIEDDEFDSQDEYESDEPGQIITGRKALFAKAEQLHNQSEEGSESEGESEEEAELIPQAITNKTENKQRVLILASRGITHRYRHLMSDLQVLLPHSKKGIIYIYYI